MRKMEVNGDEMKLDEVAFRDSLLEHPCRPNSVSALFRGAQASLLKPPKPNYTFINKFTFHTANRQIVSGY